MYLGQRLWSRQILENAYSGHLVIVNLVVRLCLYRFLQTKQFCFYVLEKVIMYKLMGVWSVQSTQRRGLLNRDIFIQPWTRASQGHTPRRPVTANEKHESCKYPSPCRIKSRSKHKTGSGRISWFKRPRFCVDCTLQIPPICT